MTWRPQQAFFNWANKLVLRPGSAVAAKPSTPNPEPEYCYCYQDTAGSSKPYYRCYTTVSDAVSGTGPNKTYNTFPANAVEVPR